MFIINIHVTSQTVLFLYETLINILAPEDAPEAVECLPLSSTGVHVKWRAPPHPTWNGQIRGYRVLYVPFPRRDEVPALLNTAR